MHAVLRCIAWPLGLLALTSLTVKLVRRLIRGLRAGKRRVAYLHVHGFGACPALARFGPARSSALCQRPSNAPDRSFCPSELWHLIDGSLASTTISRPKLNTLPPEVRRHLLRHSCLRFSSESLSSPIRRWPLRDLVESSRFRPV